jgi:hypothetical protein
MTNDQPRGVSRCICRAHWSYLKPAISLLGGLWLVIVGQGCSVRFAANGTLPDSAKTVFVERSPMARECLESMINSRSCSSRKFPRALV